jgi:hypothetical protein
MELSRFWSAAGFIGSALLVSCHGDMPTPPSTPQPDQQWIKVYFKFGHADQVDTFDGTITKDLILNGTCTVPFGFKDSEQDSILRALTDSRFFDLPDTLYPIPNLRISSDPGPQVLRVEYQGKTKSLVWSYVLDHSDPRTQIVYDLWVRLGTMVRSTDTYILLPPAEGGYI